MSESTFIERTLAGEILEPEKEIESFVAKWHQAEADLPPLHEWLGMTWEEYSLWVEKPVFLRAILMARQHGVDL